VEGTSGPRARCGNCGAEIPLGPAGGLVRCEFCKSSLYVEASGTVRHFVYRPAVEPSEVEGHVNRWLFHRRRDEGARVASVRMVHYPFWRIERGARVDLVPACASPEGPLDEIESPAGELAAVRPGEVDQETLVPAASPPPDSGSSGGAWLIHVPVYHASYRLAGRDDVVLVEATSGRVIASTMPAGTLGGASRRDSAVLLGAAAALVLVGGLVPWGWAALAGWAAVCAGAFLYLARSGGGGEP